MGPRASFGGGGAGDGSVYSRINSMRERSGLAPLGIGEYADERDPDPPQEITEEVSENPDSHGQSYRDDLGPEPPWWGSVRSGVGDEPSREGHDDTVSPGGPSDHPSEKPSLLPLSTPEGYLKAYTEPPPYEKKMWRWLNFFLPLPNGLFTAYQRRSVLAQIARCNATNGADAGACAMRAQSEQAEAAYGAPLGSEWRGTVQLYRDKQPILLPMMLVGAGVGVWHAIRRGEDWKRTTIWGVLGAAAPVITTGVALYQGWPRYKKVGQSKKARRS